MLSAHLPAEQKPVVRVMSFDFGECLDNDRFKKRNGPKFNPELARLLPGQKEKYHQDMTDALWTANEAFFTSLIESTRDARIKKVVLMNGSGGQDKRQNDFNAKQGRTASCFHALDRLKEKFASKAQDIVWDVDRYLTADMYCHRQPGESWRQAVQDDSEAKDSNALYDRSKLSLLVLQTLRAAKENPDATIYFDFFDNHEGRLAGLTNFYRANQEILLPDNVVLRLHHNDGTHCKLFAEIQGRRKQRVDNYECFLRNMLECAEEINLGAIQTGKESACNLITIFHDHPERWRTFTQPEPVQAQVEVMELLPQSQHSELRELKESIDLLNEGMSGDASQEAKNFVASLQATHNAFAIDLSSLRDRGLSPSRIENSHTMHSIRTVSAFAGQISQPERCSNLRELVDDFAAKVKFDHRLRGFYKTLIVVAITAAAFLLGAAVGFGVGLGIGIATGPGAIVTSAAGAIAGATIGVAVGASIGATLFGVTGCLLSRRAVRTRMKSEADTAVLDLAKSAVAFKGHQQG